MSARPWPIALLLPGVAALLLFAGSGCRLLSRTNPQLPPELRPPEGPRAATAVTEEPDEAEPVSPEAAAGTTAPGGASPAAGNSPTAAAAPDVPAPRTVVLPAPPPPSEGKTGRLLIEPMNPLPPESAELTPLPNDPEFRRALAEWDRGPIRYIILKEEQDLFRQLTTDEDRLFFIQDFWARRDRITETTENEYRQEFWRRVSEAHRRFIDSPQPGWKTDRGRVWIVMGPPDDHENFIGRRIGSSVIRWIYRKRPNLFLEPNFIVAFRRSSSGEYQLSNDLRDFDPIFRDLEQQIRSPVQNPTFPFALPNIGEQRRVTSLSRLSLFLDLGQATAPPELYRRMGENEGKVETQEVFGAMDARTSFEFLGPLPDGRVRTGIVVGVLKGSLVSEIDEDEADSNLTIDMSVYPGGSEGEGDVIRVRDGFGPSRENYVAAFSERLVFRTEQALTAGSYLAVYRILDRTSGQASQARETFTVPDRFDDSLNLSTIVLARRLAPVDPANERPDAFTLGGYRVVPNIDATYRNGQPFAFYFQVHGASFDPSSGKRRLDVRYHFAAQQGDDWLDLGESLVYRDLENPQGWTVPLIDWPPASYRLTVSVTDRVTGDTRSQNAYFRILPGS